MEILDFLSAKPVVLKLRLLVYGLLIFFSFFIFIGVAVMKDKAELQLTGSGVIDTECPLYIDTLQEAQPVSNCNFPMAISIMFQLLFLLFRLGKLLLLVMGRMNEESSLFSDMMELAWVVTEFFAFFFTFIGACILSAGTNESCSYLNGKTGNDDYCSDLGWHSPSSAAQAGAWISTLLWLFIFIVGFLSLHRTGRIPFLGGTGVTRSGGDMAGQAPPPNNVDTPPYPHSGGATHTKY